MIATGACGVWKDSSAARLRVNLLVSRRELVHLDTLDLYVARQRHTFIKQAAAELYVEEATIKRDLGRVLLELEAQQEALIREKLGPRTVDVPVMTDRAAAGSARAAARSPAHRADPERLRCVWSGRRRDQPAGLLPGLRFAAHGPASGGPDPEQLRAGKTTLQDATLRLMPAEKQVRLSAMTGQSLYYMGRTATATQDPGGGRRARRGRSRLCPEATAE